MQTKYLVLEIQEPDFGCEGLPENMERMDRVLLKDEKGKIESVEAADAFLYQKEINQGDFVYLENGKLIKCTAK